MNDKVKLYGKLLLAFILSQIVFYALAFLLTLIRLFKKTDLANILFFITIGFAISTHIGVKILPVAYRHKTILVFFGLCELGYLAGFIADLIARQPIGMDIGNIIAQFFGVALALQWQSIEQRRKLKPARSA